MISRKDSPNLKDIEHLLMSVTKDVMLLSLHVEKIDESSNSFSVYQMLETIKYLHCFI